MDLLKKKILEEGQVRPGQILKVDSFLNHQIDVAFLNEIGKEFFRIFSDRNISKILTIEASGIAIACITAQYFQVPVVFAKKTQTSNLDGSVFSTTVHSYTHDRDYQIRVSKKYLLPEDHILIIDDFLANGCAAQGLIRLVSEAGASLEGVGIVIEKGFQDGGRQLREAGVNLRSLAMISSMSENDLTFADRVQM